MDKVITCSLCGAHCLESKAMPYEYAGEEKKACPRCWRGLLEHSEVTPPAEAKNGA